MPMNFREARNELTINLQAEIAKVIEKKKHGPDYYILIASQPNNMNSDVIENKLILIPENKKPNPIIGTILYHVDNRLGRTKRIWILPRDVMQPESMINKTGDYSDEIFHMGKAPNK